MTALYRPRLLVTGATGTPGRRVRVRAETAGWDTVGTSLRSPGHQRLDVTDRAAVRDLLWRIRPDAVIHTATGRDRTEWTAAADGAGYVATAAAEVGSRLVHVSTDSVFSGSRVHYTESDVPDPTTVYGAAKAAGETAVRVAAPEAAIVRTSVIMGDIEAGHERLTHRLVAGRSAGALYSDEVRKPVHVDDLADALLELAGSTYRGVLNVAGAEAIDRYTLGVLVAERDGLDVSRIPVATCPVGRPRELRLRTDLAGALLRVRLRGASEFLA